MFTEHLIRLHESSASILEVLQMSNQIDFQYRDRTTELVSCTQTYTVHGLKFRSIKLNFYCHVLFCRYSTRRHKLAVQSLSYFVSFLALFVCGPISAQEYIQPEYVRADQFGTSYFRAEEPRIGPTKSRFHIENLVKLENELIGLGEIIIETEKKLHLKLEKKRDAHLHGGHDARQVLTAGGSSASNAGSGELAVKAAQHEPHPEHDYSSEIA